MLHFEPDGRRLIKKVIAGYGLSNSLHCLSINANTWTTLSPSGPAPTPRYLLGFAATPDGMLYVFGGLSSSGKDGRGEREVKLGS